MSGARGKVRTWMNALAAIAFDNVVIVVVVVVVDELMMHAVLSYPSNSVPALDVPPLASQKETQKKVNPTSFTPPRASVLCSVV